MMFTKTKILSWLVVVLLVTNVSTILSFIYHRYNERIPEQKNTAFEVPGEQRTRFFRDQLGLDESQLVDFREANRTFNHEAHKINQELEFLRRKLVDEMVSQETDTAKLKEISSQIGQEHEKLKIATYTFYLDLKHHCTTEQKQKLAEIFQSLIGANQNIQLPGHQHGKFRGN